MLRDRLACATANEKIQKRLLSEPKLTLKRALELALAIEMADKDVAGQNKTSKIEVKVNKIHVNNPPNANTGNLRKYQKDTLVPKIKVVPSLHCIPSSAVFDLGDFHFQI